jgi:hypothetical protein
MYIKHKDGFLHPAAFLILDKNLLHSVQTDGSRKILNGYSIENIARYISLGVWKVVTQEEAKSMLRKLIHLNGEVIEYNFNTVSINGVAYDKEFLKQVVANIG